MVVNILDHELKGLPGKLAEAELHFDEQDGILAGAKLIGFTVWERRGGNGGFSVTFPARTYSVNGERRSFALLRPITDASSVDKIRDIIIAAYQASIEGSPQMRDPKAARIAELNDLARTAMGIASRVLQTEGITALDPAVQSRIREQVETFDDFNDGNDPHAERDFGSFELPNGGARVFWKIDYYDKAMEYGSEDPSDPSQTTRVLTIMLASEY